MSLRYNRGKSVALDRSALVEAGGGREPHCDAAATAIGRVKLPDIPGEDRCPEAWLSADRYPERLASLTKLSRPHPASFARALAMPDGEQAHRLRHHREFLDSGAGPRLQADNTAWVRTHWRATGAGSGDRRTFIGDR